MSRPALNALLSAFPAEKWEINTDAIMVGLEEVAVVGHATDEGGHSGALLRLVKGAPGMVAALRVAAQQFMAYAEQHAAKGTPEGEAKAETNRQMAKQMLAALEGAGDVA